MPNKDIVFRCVDPARMVAQVATVMQKKRMVEGTEQEAVTQVRKTNPLTGEIFLPGTSEHFKAEHAALRKFAKKNGCYIELTADAKAPAWVPPTSTARDEQEDTAQASLAAVENSELITHFQSEAEAMAKENEALREENAKLKAKS